MRTLLVIAFLFVMTLGLVGCGPKDAHQQYTERQERLTYMAESRMLVDDCHSVMLTDRPSHLSSFVQE